MKRFIDIALKYFKAHIAGFAILLIVIGAGLIIIAQFYTGWIASASEKIGVAIFTGGVFSVFFKAIQASGVFKDELAEVVFFDEEYLKNRLDIETIWGNVTRALYKNPFPRIDEKIGNIIKHLYLPSEEEFYYLKLRKEYVLSWHDKERGLIKIDIHSTGIISQKQGLENIKLKLGYQANPIDGLDTDQCSITEVVVSNENIFNASNFHTLSPEGSDEVLWIYESSISIDRPTETVVKKTIVQDINADNKHEFKTKTYVEELEVEIIYPHDSIEVEFEGFGLSFKPYGMERDGVIKRVCKDLIFGHQGYKLTFNIL